MAELNDILEKINLQVVTLEAGDVPALGALLNLFSELEDAAAQASMNGTFLRAAKALKRYTETLALAEDRPLQPLEHGVQKLQELWRAMNGGGQSQVDISALLAQLEPAGDPADSPAPSPDGKGDPGWALGEEDIQILNDFVRESAENLENVEVSLVDLEENPLDLAPIDTIFRTFHTIKGVSGFLNLPRINRIAHQTENLLDGIRQQKFPLNSEIIELVLESVDILKRLVLTVSENVTIQNPALEGDEDIEPFIARIDTVYRRAVGKEHKRLGEILVEKGILSAEAVDQGLQLQKCCPSKRIGEIFVEQKLADPQAVNSALLEQKRPKGASALQVKVDTHKLDTLIDLTGELVISQAMLKQNSSILTTQDQNLYQNMNQLSQIVSGLQKTAMSMRMVPIRHTFQKMVRLVRDLSKHAGKKVRLTMSGEETEIDRNVVDELYEPLVHMIRNSVDHGLEPPEAREAAGKDPVGTIWLRSYHKAGSMIIEIEDDGKGLDRKAILEKARKAGLVAAGSRLGDKEIFDLIFHPGLSTAREVTDVSGRGVGMDVVKRGIEKLRGRVDIRSTPGQGSTFVIQLPLTLAIIEGMVVRVGPERYILPAMSIVESFRPQKDDCFTVTAKGEMVKLRGRLIPITDLDTLFGVAGDSRRPWERLVVAVEHKDEQRGLVIDELLGKEEIVIKSLGEALKDVRGLAGGAILSDGRVGLILDIEGLFELSRHQ